MWLREGGGGGEPRGKEAAEDGFAKADDEDEVEAGDDEVVGGDVEIGGVVEAHALGYGSHVGDAAGVDAYGYGADLGKLEGVGMATEDEVARHDDDNDGREASEGCFEGFACGPVGEAAGDEHEGYGEGDADVAYEVVGVEQSGLVDPAGEVGHQESDDVQDCHGAYFVYPAPPPGKQHDEGRGGEEVCQV